MKHFITPFLVNRLLPVFLPLFLLFSVNSAFALKTDKPVFTVKKTTTASPAISSGIDYTMLVANATDKSVFINWITASELNNSHFEVERSLDQKVFETVALVLDGFTAGAGKSYKFKEDAGVVRKAKTVYYRLKQIGIDNQVSYSKVMAVQLNTTITILPGTDDVSVVSFKCFYPNNLINKGFNNVPAAGLPKRTAGIVNA